LRIRVIALGHLTASPGNFTVRAEKNMEDIGDVVSVICVR
jgi:hypothetical protein